MEKVLLIGIGGFLGSVARYLISGYIQDRTGEIFPFGTLAVNVIGCFVIGGLSELAEARAFLSPETRALVVVGVLGGFTTFSTFGNETVNLLRDGEWAFAVMNLLTHAVLAIGAVWVGRATAHAVWR
ncbi:protein crcB [Candidatus Methylomirabilis lanthanidiphila]|uniref:Fluoride-specific ion channel FluC n=1 Tax=Candidatus Methylomirabilis lanthanidiphila TaxID=2211376 RepID=A0A564ZEV1_9BACT|nr:fluoride efflux transporter CrcB [Candidatus Methylomirabilis lanthanidiphila]VUZ83794.1 protein crcB [Candidatus Methylomirabilis lanthanidiphila]